MNSNELYNALSIKGPNPKDARVRPPTIPPPPTDPPKAKQLYGAILDYNLRDDPVRKLIQRTQDTLESIELMVVGLRALWDGEGVSEMERLRRRVAELEALLAEKEE